MTANRLLPCSFLLLMLPLIFASCSSDEDNKGTDNSNSLLINEILAKNSATLPDEAGEYDDWIELYNAGKETIDIGGFSVTDDLENPVKWTIPLNNSSATTISPGSYLILWADGDPEQGTLHLGFNLNGDGENIGVYDLYGNPMDVLSFGPQNTDISYGRLPDGSNNWVFLSPPSPGQANESEAVNSPPTISDIIQAPIVPLDGEEVIVSAKATDEFGVASVTLLVDTGLATFFEIEMVEAGLHLYEATVPAMDGGSTVRYYLKAVDTDNASITDPRFAPTSFYSYTVMAPTNTRQLYINELLASNTSVNQDGNGDFDDWIEIYNASSEDIDIGGFYITDDLMEPTFCQIPTNQPLETTVPAGGFLLLWADGESSEGPLHLDFKLSADGESVGLSDDDTHGNVMIDAINFGKQTEDVSFGRSTDGGDEWVPMQNPTPGTSNTP